VWLHDLDIHGMAHAGIQAGGLTDWTMERMRIVANGRAGWDANIGTGSSNSGIIVLREVEVGWNGCGERWQTGEPWACWAQQTGGYGDGLGTTYTAGHWLIEDAFFHHNTSDGLDLRFMDGADGSDVVVRRTYAVANAGNQVKVRGNSTIENNVFIGTCGYFEGKYFMLHADSCRASGNTLQLVFTSNDASTVRHNTITGEGGVLIGATEGDSTDRLLIQNNVLVGFPTFLDPSKLSSVFFANAAPAAVSWAGNLVWNVKSGTCPSGSLCGQNPKLANMALNGFDAEPILGSPVIDKVPPLVDVTSDFLLQPRPYGANSDIGAYELQFDSPCVRAAPSLGITGSSTAVLAGTTVLYTVALRNNDSTACSATSFSLAESVPPGWNGTLGTTSLSVAPGASVSTTLNVTSASDASPGDYNISTGVSSAIGAIHTTSASANYTIAAPAPVCTRAAPSLSVSGPSTAVPAGTSVDYTVSVGNNDSNACAATSFNLAASVPSGWTDTLAATSLSIAPGASASTTLNVTSASDASPDDYNIGAGVSSAVGNVHTASASASYAVAAPAPVCGRAAPSLSLAGPSAAVPAGTSVDYTITLGNNDSSACATTSFSLAGSVPSGWSSTLGAQSLDLAPGTTGSTTLSVTSASDAPPADYNIGAGASSAVGIIHTSSASANYAVAAPAPVCTRSAPNLSLSGPSTAVPAGTSVDHSVSVGNNDSSACATTSFSLVAAVPSGWTGALGATTLDLAPGATGSTMLHVTSATDATPADYTLGVGVSSVVGAIHTSSASANYTVAAPVPVCTRAAPSLSMSGPITAVPAGTSVDYTVSVGNNDSNACSATSFNLAASVPSGWTGALGATTLNLAPGATGSTTLRVTSASNAPAAGYSIGIGASSLVGAVHTINASATYTVAAVVVALQTQVGTNKATYARGETVQIHALLRNNGTPVSGAVVTFAVSRPNTPTITTTATSGSDGYARTTYKVSKAKNASGQYTVRATWHLGAATATATATFAVL
jgi:uncharacterized membrane protein